MAVRLKRMTTGQILDRAFRLYGRNFVRFIAIVAVIQVPIVLIHLLIGRFQPGWIIDVREAARAGAPALVGHVLVAIALPMFAQAVCNGALMKGISGAYLGADTSVGQAYRLILPRLLSLIGASIMVSLVVVAGTLLLIVPGIIFALMYALTSQAIVCENIGAFRGMGRSKSLTKGNMGKVFGVVFLVTVISIVVWMFFDWMAGMLHSLPTSETLRETTWPNLVISSIFRLISRTLTAPLSAGALILLYYDRRIRKERFDLEMLAQSMGAPAAG